MSLCLALIFREQDAKWFSLHLPIYRHAFGDAIAFSDELGGEAESLLRSMDVDVQYQPWCNRWGDYWNSVHDYARSRGFDFLFRMDPDELVYPEIVANALPLLETYKLISLPRYNFWYDRTQWHCQGAYPDTQARIMTLDGRARYVGARHEIVSWGGHANETCTMQGHTNHLFHFGDIGQENIYARALRYYNFERAEREGLPPVDALPSDKQPGAPTVPFPFTQPVDPQTVGICAPFSA